MRTGAALAGSLILLAAAAGPAAAQAGEEPADTAAAADTVRADSAVADTLPPDSLRADTLPADTLPADTLPADTVPAAGRDTAGRRGEQGPGTAEIREALTGGRFPERDSIFQRMLELPGYRAVEYRGRRVTLEVPDRRIRLRDSAQVNYGEAALRADSIDYRARLQFMAARGAIDLASPGQRRMTTDSVLYYDVSRLKGTVLDARTSFAQQGATWNVQGDAVPVGQKTVYVNRGSFTSCDRDVPHYWFKAGQIKMVSQDVVVAWPVTFYVSEVPIFWLPFFAQDIRPDRRSGIIPPQFGFNDVVRTSDNFQRQISDVGYYWAINRFMDLRTTLDWFSGQFTRVNADFRYYFMKDFIEGSVGLSREWGERGNNFEIDAQHQQRLTPHTDISVDANFVQSERLARDRSFDPRLQTRTIDTDVGIRHDADFANLQLSARRSQELGEDGGVTSTLPNASVSFSPVTLFEAPPNRAGLFNNLTWRGSASFRRQQQARDLGDDVTNLTGSLSQSLSLGRLNVSASGDFNQQETDRLRLLVSGDTLSPDTTRVELSTSVQTDASWTASADYQVSLLGSTSLRPTVDLSGGWFRSDVPPDTVRGDTVRDTDGEFIPVPTRASFGASLSTDLFGFFPGFGPFSRIRHKISPRFNWRFSPEVTLSDTTLARVPGFPGGGGQARNELSVTLNQTFEAKMPGDEGRDGTAPGTGRRGGRPDARAGEGGTRDTADAAPGAGADTVRAAGEAVPDTTAASDTAAGAAGTAPDTVAAADTTGARRDTTDGRRETDDRRDGGAATRGRDRERKVTLLAIRSDALRFDFERAKMGEPVLVTDRWGNSISSDLLRGLSLNITHDLFEGRGEDRKFSPFLSEVNASFSLSSGTSLGDIFGLSPGGGRAGGVRRRPSAGRYGRGAATGFGGTGGAAGQTGTWNLSLRLSISRSREDGDDGGSAGGSFGFGRGDSQTLQGSLSLNPTPNWRMSWNTSYNISDNEFSSQRVSLVRDLHRWRARFQFEKAPNGNFRFRFLVRLTDAPDLKVDYDQQSVPPGSQ